MKELRVLYDGGHIATIAAITQSDFINIACLGAGVRRDFNIPDNANIVMFSATRDFYCLIGPSARASIYAGDVLDGSASELNPIARGVSTGDKISLISPVDCKVIMAFYR